MDKTVKNAGSTQPQTCALGRLLPNYSLQNLRQELALVFILLTVLLYQELFATIVASFFFTYNHKSPSRISMERLYDCGCACLCIITGPLWGAVQRILFLPLTPILALLTFTALVIQLLWITLKTLMGISLNILYLCVNNIFIHTLLIGITLNLIPTLCLLIPSIVDQSARRCLIKHLQALGSGGLSIVMLLKTIITQPASILLGLKYLSLADSTTALTIENHQDECWALLDMPSNVPTSIEDSIHTMCQTFYCLRDYGCYILTAPLFLALYPVQTTLIAANILAKAAMTIPLIVLTPITRRVFAEQKHPLETFPTLCESLSTASLAHAKLHQS